MHSIAPRPCAFMRSRARSNRYFRIRSQLTRCCQSSPAIPKLAPMFTPRVVRDVFFEKRSVKAEHAGRSGVKDRPGRAYTPRGPADAGHTGNHGPADAGRYVQERAMRTSVVFVTGILLGAALATGVAQD